jgi:hypothetical protein
LLTASAALSRSSLASAAAAAAALSRTWASVRVGLVRE